MEPILERQTWERVGRKLRRSGPTTRGRSRRLLTGTLHLGQAYILHGNEGEVKVTPFEGKKAPVRLFRIATFPQIKKESPTGKARPVGLPRPPTKLA
ncbi:MAG: hypothetical protein WD556_07785 [Actinomycetota bacterium]